RNKMEKEIKQKKPKDITPKHFDFPSAKDRIQTEDEFTQRIGGLGTPLVSDVKESVDITDNAFSGYNLITDVINARLNSATKKILSDFDFGTTDYAGALKSGDLVWDTETGALESGSGVVVYRKGILGAKDGATTFSIDAETGDATFAGTLSAASGTLGAITIGTNAYHIDTDGNMWWGTAAEINDAVYKIDSNGESSLSNLYTGNEIGFIKSFTAGQDISRKDAIRLGWDTTKEYTVIQQLQNDTSFQIARYSTEAPNRICDVKYNAQSFSSDFALTIKKIQLAVNESATGDMRTPPIKVGIKADNGGVPADAWLASTADYSCVFAGQAGTTYPSFTLSSPYAISANTTYWIVAEIQSTTPGEFDVGCTLGSPNTNSTFNIRLYSNGTVYPNGKHKYRTTEAGSWTDGGSERDMYFKLIVAEVVGYLYKADATSQNNIDRFIGFAAEDMDIMSIGTKSIFNKGIYPFTGLTASSVYYLSDTPGAISTSAGSVEKKIGVALDTSYLFLY
ncbi:MAG: hypothetical protein PHW73_12815, partial [Atribacterota bacterium]|nr:hypothetical protein [Atribacterota bacterium]